MKERGLRAETVRAVRASEKNTSVCVRLPGTFPAAQTDKFVKRSLPQKRAAALEIENNGGYHMQFLKRMLALGLCGVAALTVAACAPRDSETSWGNNNSDSGGGAYSEIDDEEVKSITVFKNDWAAFNNARQANSPVYQKLKEQIGCDIEALNSSGANWQNQLALLQSDNDLPDIFLTEGPNAPEFFDKLIKNEDIISISDWVSEEHYPNIYKHMQEFDYMRSNVSYARGKTWFIPSSWHNEKSLYVRQDWIDNLNNKLADVLILEGVISSEGELTAEKRAQWQFKTPETLLDFYRLARAFTLYDPDNNGADDTFGYMSESNQDMDAWIYMAFDTGWNQFVEDKATGKYTHSDITEGSMYATAFITRLIADGYMSQDSLTADNGTKQDRFVQGKAGMIYAHNWLNNFVSGIMAVDKCSLEDATAKVAMCDPPAGKNGTWNGAGEAGYWQGFCINANNSNSRIRKCLELYDYLLSDEGYELLQYGVEGVHYEKDAAGKKTSLLEKDKDGFYKTIVSVDTATMLYALVDWTMHYKVTTCTNAEIICARQERSEAHSYFSDYPDLQTEAGIEYLTECHSLFEETISVLESNQKNMFWNPADWTYNALTFGWDDLYIVSKAFQSKWNSFVRNYKESYSGDEMIEEYNSYIDGGHAVKAGTGKN